MGKGRLIMDITELAILNKMSIAYTDNKFDAITTDMDYKGSVASVANLPVSGTLGDVYTVTSTGARFVWDGTQWTEIGNYTTLSNDVNTLNNAFYTVHGFNRNPNNDVSGYLKSDGTLAQYGDWKTTDYCYVGDLENICASCNGVGYTQRLGTALYFLCLYDESKAFIKQVDTGGSYTWAVEEGTLYVRFCYHSDVVENIMLESGTSYSSAFVEYEEPKKMLKNSYYNSGADWSDKLWVCVGDSLTEVNIRTTKHYHDYIADATGIEVSNMGYSGSGYKRGEGENNAFYQRILNVPNNADVVTIFGSGNDLNYTAMGFGTFDDALGSPTDTGTSTICGCINTAIDNLYSVLPTVQLGIITPTPWASYSPLTANNDMDKYSNAIVSICRRRGIPCLDLYHESGMRPWEATYRQLCYSKDEGEGTHPDETGHEIMAPHFKAFLEKIVL